LDARSGVLQSPSSTPPPPRLSTTEASGAVGTPSGTPSTKGVAVDPKPLIDGSWIVAPATRNTPAFGCWSPRCI